MILWYSNLLSVSANCYFARSATGRWYVSQVASCAMWVAMTPLHDTRRVLPEVISIVVAPSDSTSSSRTCVDAFSGNNDLQVDLIFRSEDCAGSKHCTAISRTEILQQPMDMNWKWDVRTDLWKLLMLKSWFWCLVVSMIFLIVNNHTLSWISGIWLHSRESLKPCTGRFIRFSVIKNIYNKKTKGLTLMELFTATGKLKKFLFWQLELFEVCTTGDMAHIDTIFKFLHTRVNMSASIVFTAAMIRAFRSARSHGNGVTNIFAYFARNAPCTITTDLLVWYSNTQNVFFPRAAIFSLHTLASPSGRNVNYDEKQLTGGKKIELFLLSVQVS